MKQTKTNNTNAEFNTPMMLQYQELKNKYPDCILLFRLGDFYEMFMDDAKLGSAILNITLTSRDRGKDGRIPMAGVPYHALDAYLPKLVKAGYKVAICEQLTDPGLAKLVERDVVRIVTPGTLLNENSIEKKENNYIIGIHIEGNNFGLALADISTGVFQAAEYAIDSLEKVIVNELAKYNPTECVLPPAIYNNSNILKLLKTYRNLNIFPFFDWDEYAHSATDVIKNHFEAVNLQGFGFDERPQAVRAAAGLLGYLKYTQKDRIQHINKITPLAAHDYVDLDRATINNLEIFSTVREGLRKGSLLHLLDETKTSMGGRLLKSWIIKPLKNKQNIENRLNITEELLNKRDVRNTLLASLEEIGDVERILSRIAVGIGNPRDMVNLKNSLIEANNVITKATASVKSLKILKSQNSPQLAEKCKKLIKYISDRIIDEPPIDPKNAGFIKTGINNELDKLHKIVHGSKEFIADLEQKERKKTGISSLKIRFNQVFGYYIEITKSNLSQVPKDYYRKQTLVNAERFITHELKEHEEIILSAEEKIKEIEYQMFLETAVNIVKNTQAIQEISQVIAEIDCLTCFAQVAEQNNYTKPVLTENNVINIKGGRHAVVEKLLEEKEFVSNDTFLDENGHQLLIITGPNMAGKSVYIRQVALITLMAQIGCFVPAEKAEIGIVDKIFVRSGASDVITSGLSTFMVEMVETANILNNVTSQSLIVMDEIGRGTSTYDGISIAWAVAEYLVSSKKLTPKTLFATHYHELQKLEEKFPDKIKNFQFSAVEESGNPVFLHKIKSGGADHSFGISVAKIAGVPKEVCERATQILSGLESNGKNKATK